MEIVAAMLEFALRKRGHEARLIGDEGLVVQRIRAYKPRSHEQGTLYVSGSSSAAPKIPPHAGFAVMRFDGEASDGVVEAYDALREIDAWDSQLNNALLNGASLKDFIDMGRDMLGCPLAYFDRNLIVLAASDDYWDFSAGAEGAAESLHVAGQMPANRAADLIEDADYLHAAEIHGGFYYESSQNRMYYGMNTFDNGEYLARLVLALPADGRRLHRGQEQLIDRYHVLLDDLHLRYAGNANVVSSQNDALHELVRQMLFDEEVPAQPSKGETAGILASFGWMPSDTFVLAQLVFFEGLHWNTVSLYLCGLLERAMAGSCAFPSDQQIIWLVDLSRSARVGEGEEKTLQRFTESLVAVLRNYACKAGISDDYADFSLSRNAYKEAGFALGVGQSRDPHYWYFRFRDYALDYLIAKCGEDLEPAQVCHPALETLLAYDAEHGTEHARTLVCYVRNNQNTTHAANELFIHRTSFMRRMAAIEGLTGVDLADSDTVLHLLLSAKLLGM